MKGEAVMSKNYASKVISVAEKEVGYLEKATNSQLDSKTANAGYNNWNKYAAFFDKKHPDFYNGGKNGYHWCDIFVDWCFVTAYGYEEGRKLLCQPLHSTGAGCSYSAQFYKNKGQFHYRNETPKAGDQIFFGSDPYHTGLVYKVDSTYVYTIEGNTSSDSGVIANGGCVAKKKYYRTYSEIHGYGRPKFDAEPKKVTMVKFKNNGAIYKTDWKDVVGGASKSIKSIKKGEKVEFVKDVKYGWSKVKSGNVTGYTMNPNLSKLGLSKFPTKTLAKDKKVILIENKKASKTVTIKKGTKITVICEIMKGKYAGYSYFKVGKDKKRYYGKV
jgi:hypothetical protein